MAELTQWEKIYKHLKNKGYEVYSPNQHQGEFKKNYVVVKDNGLLDTNVSSSQHLFDILVYVKNYSEIEGFVQNVIDDMDELFPAIRPTHSRTAPYFDDFVKAFMVSIEYVNYRKNHRR